MKENLSTKFILPMLGINWRDFLGSVNCYIGDEIKGQEFNNHIFVLFDTKHENYNRKIDFLKNHNLYITSYSYDTYEMYVFNVPFQEEYDLFKKGKYSKFKIEYKNHIINFFTNKISKTPVIRDSYLETLQDNFLPMQTYMQQILFRSEKLYERYEKLLLSSIPRENELCSSPNMKDEIFNNYQFNELFNIKNVNEWI